MRKYLLLILTLLCAASLNATAQGNGQNVTWQYNSKTLPNGSVELFFDADISDGFRLYSPYNPKDASKPLNITLEQSNDFTTDGKIIELQKPEEHYEEIFEATEKYFKKTAKFKIVIHPTTDKPFETTGSLDGQVCNDEMFCAMVMDKFKISVTPAKPKEKQEKKATDAQKTDDAKPVTSPTAKKDSIANPKPDTSVDADTTTVTKTEKNATATSDTTKSEITAPLQNSSDTPTPSSTDGKKESMWWIFAIAFLAGLAAIFTPCVFPMIPMTVTFFLKDKSGKGRMNAIIYGISIILLYTVPVAILIAISNMIGGANFTAGLFNALSTHWLPNVIFFVIFMVFALSFLGMFEIVMPSSLINRAEKRGDKGGIIGVFFLAFVLVLVSFSCTGPIVGSVLVESASGGNYMKPIVAILGFSLAFAMPFTLFAFFPEILKGLPKSGGWLNTVKVVLGFVELALGLKFLSVADQTYHWHILDRETYLAIWIAIGFLLTAYLLGKLKLPNDSDIDHIKVPRLILAIICLSFTVYMIPGLFGAPLKALAGYIPPITTQDFVIGTQKSAAIDTPRNAANSLCGKPLYSDFLKLPHGVEAYFEYNEAAACARKQNKPLLIVFTGHGCVNCRKMEENVWTDARVQNKMQNDFVLCALYTDDRTVSSDGTQTIGQVNTEIQISRYNINAQPYYIIADPNTGAMLQEPMSYNPDVESVLQWLGGK